MIENGQETKIDGGGALSIKPLKWLTTPEIHWSFACAISEAALMCSGFTLFTASNPAFLELRITPAKLSMNALTKTSPARRELELRFDTRGDCEFWQTNFKRFRGVHVVPQLLRPRHLVLLCGRILVEDGNVHGEA